MDEHDELKQIFDQLKAEHNIEDLATFSSLDISEKLQRNEMMVIKYKEMYYNELNKYEILERKMDALKGLRYKHYKFEDDNEWQKKEIEEYCLPSDPQIIQLKKLMMRQQVRVRFFDMCHKAFTSMGWSMKTFTDREKNGL
jgi:hypothetical protein